MTELPFSVKYRPKKLSEVIGQYVPVVSISNAFKEGKMHHAYIFAGNLGSGKTSLSRIVAAMENCEKGRSLDPCGECDNCKSIFTGKSRDVIELDAASNRGIDDIRSLKQEIKFAPVSGRMKIVIIDECLSNLSRIDTDIGRIPIGIIVNNKLTPKVKSFNHQTGQIEYKEITGWFKNSGKEIFNVRFEGKGTVYSSSGHMFATPSGYKPLKDLKINDKVLRIGRNLNCVQKQIILGSLLGDMNIQRNSSVSQKWGEDRKFSTCRCRIKMIHGCDQFEYLEFKKQLLESSLSFNGRDFKHAGWGGDPKPMRSYVSKTSSCLSNIFNMTINTSSKRPKKIVNEKWLEEIDDIGLATWFCDDGSVARTKTKNGFNPVVSLHTQGFKKYENEIIQKWLKNIGFNSTVRSAGKNNLWHVVLDTASSQHFLERISPYIHPSIRYKIRDIKNLKEFDADLYASENGNDVSEEVITSIKSMGYKDTTYDLEIKDNNNYFCSDTLVHNCHSLSSQAAEALLKAIEEPPPYVRFILATTDPHQLIDTIRSRCQVLMFNKISWAELTEHLKFVCNKEKIEFEDGALQMCARAAGGSVRNALQNLQAAVALASGGKLTLDISKKSLGAIDDNLFFHLIDAISSANAAKCMQVISALFKDGKSATEILDGFLGHLRILLRSLTCKQELSEFGLPEDAAKRYNYQASTVKISVLLNMISLLTDVGRGISLNLDPQIMMEKYVIDSIILVKTNTD